MQAIKNVNITKDDESISFCFVLNTTIKTGGNGLWSTAKKDVQVQYIAMHVDTTGDDGHGDLAICYDNSTWNNDSDGLIYTDKTFLGSIKAELIAAGFDADAVNDIDYSEQGMQDDERVSCDAFEFAELLLKMYS